MTADEVTPEMESEGLRVMEELKRTFPDYLLVRQIYAAMDAVRPDEIPLAKP